MTWRDYAARIAKAFDVSLDELLGRSNAHAFTHPRQALYLLLHVKNQWGATMIGRRIGRDHGTVSAGIRTARHRLLKDGDFAARYEAAAS